jgi:hypothetical protein
MGSQTKKWTQREAVMGGYRKINPDGNTNGC